MALYDYYLYYYYYYYLFCFIIIIIIIIIKFFHLYCVWLSQIKYYHDIHQVISCSNHENTALVIGGYQFTCNFQTFFISIGLLIICFRFNSILSLILFVHTVCKCVTGYSVWNLVCTGPKGGAPPQISGSCNFREIKLHPFDVFPSATLYIVVSVTFNGCF